MPMPVAYAWFNRLLVHVPVVRIVHVLVIVLHRFVGMFVDVTFADMQP